MFTNANTHYEAFIYYVNSVRMQMEAKLIEFAVLAYWPQPVCSSATVHNKEPKPYYFSPFANTGADWFFAFSPLFMWLATLSASLAASMSFWLRKLGWLVEDSNLAHILSVILTLFLVDVTLCGQDKFSHVDCKSNITRDREEFCLSHMEATLFPARRHIATLFGSRYTKEILVKLQCLQGALQIQT